MGMICRGRLDGQGHYCLTGYCDGRARRVIPPGSLLRLAFPTALPKKVRPETGLTLHVFSLIGLAFVRTVVATLAWAVIAALARAVIAALAWAVIAALARTVIASLAGTVIATLAWAVVAALAGTVISTLA
ncbi:hypothetical protein, partial [Rhizobium ruizarguesonis]|uniref:hypothetical protein n=1 Tax=Rhizobium ruizarguesonis TaxID=2081791 RepID=UPI0013EEC82A